MITILSSCSPNPVNAVVEFSQSTELVKKERKRMPTDVILDQGQKNNTVVLAAEVVKATASDFILDSLGRRTGGSMNRKDGHRRALVHDSTDGLTVNFNGDYPSGVTIFGSTINLNTLTPDSPGAGDVTVTFFHPDELDQDGNPRVAGFNETVLLGALLTTLRNEISLLKEKVAKLESK